MFSYKSAQKRRGGIPLRRMFFSDYLMKCVSLISKLIKSGITSDFSFPLQYSRVFTGLSLYTLKRAKNGENRFLIIPQANKMRMWGGSKMLLKISADEGI